MIIKRNLGSPKLTEKIVYRFAAEGRIIGLKASSACQFQRAESNARIGKQLEELEGQQRGNKGDY
jgi:hypothetical protein